MIRNIYFTYLGHLSTLFCPGPVELGRSGPGGAAGQHDDQVPVPVDCSHTLTAGVFPTWPD